MGYADVGADIYVVLGVIAFFAGVVSPIAFAIAAIVYVCTGLCYAELATRARTTSSAGLPVSWSSLFPEPRVSRVLC